MTLGIWENGGDDRNRTCDILLAKQTLYQLSYIPTALTLKVEAGIMQSRGGVKHSWKIFLARLELSRHCRFRPETVANMDSTRQRPSAGV